MKKIPLRPYRLYVAAAITGGLLLPLLVLLIRPELIDFHYGPETSPLSSLGSTVGGGQGHVFEYTVSAPYLGRHHTEVPPVDDNVLRLVTGLFAVQDYNSLAKILDKFTDETQKVILTFGISTETNRLSPSSWNDGLDSDVPQVTEEHATEVESLLAYVDAIRFPEVRARGYLDIAPLSSDSSRVLKKSLACLESVPEVWRSIEQQDALGDAPIHHKSDSDSIAAMEADLENDAKKEEKTNSSNTSDSTWFISILATLGGFLGLTITYVAVKFFELPIQNLGKAVVSQALVAGGFPNAASAARTGESQEDNTS